MTKNTKHNITIKKVSLWLGCLIILALAVLWRLENIDAFGLNNDEGAYLMWGRLVSEGYALYSQTYTGSPPVFVALLALVFKAFGFGIVVGRVLVLLFFVGLALIFAAFAKHIADWVGIYAALVIVTILTPLFILSRQVMLEIPAMTLALAAVGCAYLYFMSAKNQAQMDNKRVWLLVLAGSCIALSLLMKLLHPFAVLPIAYFIWFASDSLETRFKHGVLFGLSIIITTLVVLAFFEFEPLFDQVIRFRSETRGDVPVPLDTNWERFTAYVFQIWGLALLALAGLVASVRRVRTQAWGVWLLFNFILVMWYNPVFPHHFSLILAPAILLALELIAFCQFERKYLWAWGLVGVALFNIPALVTANQAILSITTGGREAEAAQILNQVTRPADFVMSDSQLLALLADRRTPPPLVDFSLVYIKSGRHTPPRLIKMSNDYAVSAVASWALRMVWLPEYITWAEENYWVRKVWDNDHILYFGPKHPPNQPIPNQQATTFEQNVQLSGYHVDTDDIKAGSPLALTLYWQATAPIQKDYTIFIQVLNASGQLVAQNDSRPLFGYFPTTQWPPQEIIPDRVLIDLPPDLEAGNYTIISGMYDLDSLTRLKRLDTGQDYSVLTEVTND